MNAHELAAVVRRGRMAGSLASRTVAAERALADLEARAARADQLADTLRLLCDAIESDAAEAAYGAEMGASEWEAFVCHRTYARLVKARDALAGEAPDDA